MASSYFQRPSPGRRCSLMLPPSEYSTCRARSSSTSVVDMKNFSPALTVSYRGAPHKPSCATPCFVSPRMAFTTQFSYDSPIQILTSSPKSMPRIRGLRKLSTRMKLLVSGLLLSLAFVLYIFRVHVVAEGGLDTIGECSDKFSCTDTKHSLFSIQSIVRSASPPQQDLASSVGDNIDKNQEDAESESGDVMNTSKDNTPTAGKAAGQVAGDVDVNKDDLLPDTATQKGERYRSKRHTVEGQYMDEDEQDGFIEDHTTKQQQQQPGGEVQHRQPKAPNQLYPESIFAEDEQDYSKYGMIHDDDYSVPPEYMQQQQMHPQQFVQHENYDYDNDVDDEEQLPHYYPNTLHQQQQFMDYGHFNEENQHHEESDQQEKYYLGLQQEQQQHQQQQDPYQPHQQNSYNHQQQKDQYQQPEQYTTDQYIQHQQHFTDQYSTHQHDLQRQQQHQPQHLYDHQSPQVSQDDTAALHMNTQGQQNDKQETRQSNQETTHQEQEPQPQQQRDPQYETISTTTPRSQSQRKRPQRNGPHRSNENVEIPEGRDARLLQKEEEEAAPQRMKRKPTTEARQNEARMKPQEARMEGGKEPTVKVDSRVNRQLRRRESGPKRGTANNSPTSSTPPRNNRNGGGGGGRRDRDEGKTSQRIVPGVNPRRYTHNDL